MTTNDSRELDRLQHDYDRLHEANAKLRDRVQLLEEQAHALRVQTTTARELERRRCGDLARHYGASGFLVHAIEAGLPHPFSCMVEMTKPAAETVCTQIVKGVDV